MKKIKEINTELLETEDEVIESAGEITEDLSDKEEFELSPIKHKRKILIVCIILIVVILGVATVLILNMQKTSTIAKELELGEKYLEEGLYEEAKLSFDKVIEIDDKEVKAYEGKAEVLLEMGDYAKAEELLMTAQNINEKYEIKIMTDTEEINKYFISIFDKALSGFPEDFSSIKDLDSGWIVTCLTMDAYAEGTKKISTELTKKYGGIYETVDLKEIEDIAHKKINPEILLSPSADYKNLNFFKWIPKENKIGIPGKRYAYDGFNFIIDEVKQIGRRIYVKGSEVKDGGYKMEYPEKGSPGVLYCDGDVVGSSVFSGYKNEKKQIDFSFTKELKKWVYVLEENPNGDYYLISKNKVGEKVSDNKVQKEIPKEMAEESNNQKIKITGEFTKPKEYQINNEFKVNSSSIRKAMGSNQYNPENLMDKSSSTAWIEGSQDSGIGEWIEFVFQGKEPRKWNGIAIENGYGKSEKTFQENGSPRSLSVYINDEYKHSLLLTYSKDIQYLNLPSSMMINFSDKIKFTIESVQEGNADGKYDTAITEINFY